MIPYHRLLERAFNVPLLVTPQKAEVIGAILLSRAAQAHTHSSGENAEQELQAFPVTANADGTATMNTPRASRFYGEYLFDEESGKVSPYRITKDGRVAIITIVGELVNRGAWLGASSGLVSYEAIAYQVTAAANDPRAKSILLDIESPGGEAVGCFEVAGAIRKASTIKPVTALVNGMACSAAYAIASGASRIVSIPTGISGSIGVVMMHVDFSVALQLEGIKPTFIFEGAHKVDGNPYEPLSKEVHAYFQEECRKFYDLFVAGVVEGRAGKMTDAQVRATEARVYLAEEALSVGLIDQIATFDEILAEMNSTTGYENVDVSEPPNSTEDTKMKGSLWNKLQTVLGGMPAEESETPVTDAANEGQDAGAAVAEAVAATDALAKENATLKADLEKLQEIKAKSDAEAAEKLKAEQDARAKEAADRATAQTAAFEKGLTHHGASTRRDLTALYQGAVSGTLTMRREKADAKKDATDAEKYETVTAAISPEAGAIIVAHLSSLATAIPPAGAAERRQLGGEKAEAAARSASGDGDDQSALHFEALERTRKAGYKEGDAKFSSTYGSEMAALKKERGNVS